MGGHLFIWLAFLLCLVLSFIFSGMEAGVFALSRLRIRQQMRAGRRSAAVLHRFLEHPEEFLWTILVGNTLANFLILGWLVFVFHHALQARLAGFIVVFTVAVFLFYAGFDLLPKMLFRAYPNRLCVGLARPFRLLALTLQPLVAIVQSVSGLLLRWRGGKVFTGYLFGNREEMRLVMQESAQGLSSEERTMINRVLDLQSITVRQAMVPLGATLSVRVQSTVREVLELGRARGLTRFPVWDTREGRQRVVGLVSLNTFLFRPDLDQAKTIAEHVRPALYLDEDLRLEVGLRRMQRAGERLAIVLSRDRRESGILTLQDILKVMFGEVSL